MIVMKFGGTSVEDAAAIERAGAIVRQRLPQQPVVIVSALAGVTDQLVCMSETAASGDRESTRNFRAKARPKSSPATRRPGWKTSISNTATITQSIVSLWKTNDWSDSLHNFTVGVAASVTTHTELKFEFLDSFKNRPLPGLKKNDTALITAFVWKL